MSRDSHDAVLVTTWREAEDLPDVDAFRAGLDARFRRLVIGPVTSAINGWVSYAFLPDGSKEGWAESDMGDKYREAFRRLFDPGDLIVTVHVGGDDGLTWAARDR